MNSIQIQISNERWKMNRSIDVRIYMIRFIESDSDLFLRSKEIKMDPYRMDSIKIISDPNMNSMFDATNQIQISRRDLNQKKLKWIHIEWIQLISLDPNMNSMFDAISSDLLLRSESINLDSDIWFSKDWVLKTSRPRQQQEQK